MTKGAQRDERRKGICSGALSEDIGEQRCGDRDARGLELCFSDTGEVRYIGEHVEDADNAHGRGDDDLEGSDWVYDFAEHSVDLRGEVVRCSSAIGRKEWCSRCRSHRN